MQIPILSVSLCKHTNAYEYAMTLITGINVTYSLCVCVILFWFHSSIRIVALARPFPFSHSQSVNGIVPFASANLLTRGKTTYFSISSIFIWKKNFFHTHKTCMCGEGTLKGGWGADTKNVIWLAASNDGWIPNGKYASKFTQISIYLLCAFSFRFIFHISLSFSLSLPLSLFCRFRGFDEEIIIY